MVTRGLDDETIAYNIFRFAPIIYILNTYDIIKLLI